MTRYFFDVKSRISVQYDYEGRYLHSLTQAQELAELIAMDLGCSRIDGSFPMEVQIKVASGLLLASVPVLQMDALAA
jgi:hypothetical protein